MCVPGLSVLSSYYYYYSRTVRGYHERLLVFHYRYYRRYDYLLLLVLFIGRLRVTRSLNPFGAFKILYSVRIVLIIINIPKTRSPRTTTVFA